MVKQELIAILNLLKVMLVEYMFSDDRTSSKAMIVSHLGRQSSWFQLKTVKLRFQ